MSYLEQKSYNEKTVAEVQQEQNNKLGAIINGGYPTYNTCDHTTLDMSHLKNGTDKYMHTLSIKLDDDSYVTINVMKLMGDETNIDVGLHGNVGDTRAINFKEGKSETMHGLGTLAIVSSKKK